MGHRRKAREITLQILYEVDMGTHSPKEVLAQFWRREPVTDDIQAFATTLVEGVVRNMKEIDVLIETHSTNWKLSRMAVIDRNILRFAIFEIVYLSDVPVSVSLNEAIEVAKKYGTVDSGAFINGVLDNIAKSL